MLPGRPAERAESSRSSGGRRSHGSRPMNDAGSGTDRGNGTLTSQQRPSSKGAEYEPGTCHSLIGARRRRPDFVRIYPSLTLGARGRGRLREPPGRGRGGDDRRARSDQRPTGAGGDGKGVRHVHLPLRVRRVPRPGRAALARRARRDSRARGSDLRSRTRRSAALSGGSGSGRIRFSRRSGRTRRRRTSWTIRAADRDGSTRREDPDRQALPSLEKRGGSRPTASPLPCRHLAEVSRGGMSIVPPPRRKGKGWPGPRRRPQLSSVTAADPRQARGQTYVLGSE